MVQDQEYHCVHRVSAPLSHLAQLALGHSVWAADMLPLDSVAWFGQALVLWAKSLTPAFHRRHL